MGGLFCGRAASLAAIGGVWQGGVWQGGGGVAGDSKPEPNLAKLSKIQPRPAKNNQRKRLGFPWILLSESSLFKGLRRPQPAFFLFPPSPRVAARAHPLSSTMTASCSSESGSITQVQIIRKKMPKKGETD
jgi:hypothetical protein